MTQLNLFNRKELNKALNRDRSQEDFKTCELLQSKKNRARIMATDFPNIKDQCQDRELIFN